MTSPSKIKQTSLSQFYRKLQYHEQSMSMNQSDQNLFYKIHSSPQSKINSQYSELDLQSNMKKDQKMFLQKFKNHHSPIISSKKSSPQKTRPQNQYQNLQIKTKSEINQNEDTSFDYNLSVQPQQIQIPQVSRKQSNTEKQADNVPQIKISKAINIRTPQKNKRSAQKLSPQYSDVVQRLNWAKTQNNETNNKKSVQKINDPPKQMSSPILSSDDQEGSEILMKCNQLQSRVKSLKQQKYDFAIQKYRSQCQKQLQKELQLQTNKINASHNSKVANIQNAFGSQKTKFEKVKQDIKKYKQAYELILNELSSKKDKIFSQFQQSLQKVKASEQKSISEWKRQSNQEIKKIINQKSLMF